MVQTIRYLTHPQVLIDPGQDIQKWSLNDVGQTRVAALAASAALQGTTRVISSAETKALETAQPLADALGVTLEVREKMHENDRSATGFLPPEEFERVADQFFAAPDVSARGWETARAAQARIVAEVAQSLATPVTGDVLFVGHGGVGTLLYCHLRGGAISRAFDQGPGGGCVIAYPADAPGSVTGWQPLEALMTP